MCIRDRWIINGLYTFNWKWPWVHANVTEFRRPITCAHTIDKASHWVGLIFPGIIDEPGSLAGSIISEIPLLGPEANTLISFAILNNALVKISTPDITSINTSWDARDSYLLGADLNGSFVSCFKYLINFLEKL